MGMLGELFPGPKIRDESGEEGSGQQWRLGPIDLDNRTVHVHAPEPADDEEPGERQDA
ncbi:hypothetical protein [Pseudonocardia nigra]|uniref:hypothetical protein n=1 Tax=Pseudonocardia nigra TaxID=1921578 RepID=UPI001C5F5499|nr:hypothetical protein [Pseudonocardia nigra]